MSLRDLLGRGRPLIVPGATDALSARLIQAHGYEAVYIGSYATAASRFGLPDTELLSLDELAAQARTIAPPDAAPGPQLARAPARPARAPRRADRWQALHADVFDFVRART